MADLRFAQVEMESMECCVCGIIFGVPITWTKERRKDGKGFSCPNKHRLTFGETEEDRLKKRLKRLRNEKDEAVQCCDAALEDTQHQANRVRGYKGALVSQRNRLVAGRNGG